MVRTTSTLTRTTRWLTALVAALAITAVHAQTPEDPAQSREALRRAIDHYKRGEFDSATQYFEFAQKAEAQLSPAEQKDLADFSSQNAVAVKARQDALTQLKQADEAMKQNQPMEVSRLLSQLTANQFLTPAERQRVVALQRQTQVPGGPLPKADVKALLAAARTAMQAGDYAGADTLISEAESVGSAVPNWVTPWSDSPAKLRRELQAAKEKQPTPANATAKVEPKDSSWLSMRGWFGKPEEPAKKLPEPPPAPSDANKSSNTTKLIGGLWPFGSNPPAKKDATPPSAPKPTPPSGEEQSSERKIDDLMARKMVADGFMFMDQGDIAKARFVANKAKELNVSFGPMEPTPDALLHEIQRREAKNAPAAKPSEPVVTEVAPTPEQPKRDPHLMLREARNLLNQKKYDEADKMCNQLLNSNARWGLFADTPEKLRRDIQKVRQSAEREESVQVMAEARKLYMNGSYEEAERKAHKAAELHGPYGVFDFGDRPQKLLDEIQRARQAKGIDDAPKKVVQEPEKKTPVAPPPALQNANKNQAIAMVAEARKLERQGQLSEARQKALEAGNLKATFAPGEDSPDAVLLSLQAGGDRRIQDLMKEATDTVMSASDVQRFQRAVDKLSEAKRLSIDFNLDFGRVDQRYAWVQQIASGKTPTPENNNIAQASNTLFQQRPLTPMQQKGHEILKLAQLELSHGKYNQARKMAEGLLHNPMFDIREDVLRFIRTIDAEEYNQRVLDAKRRFDSGMEAYAKRQYKSAHNLLQSIDPQMLTERHSARLRSVMSSREMQPDQLVQAQYSPERVLPSTVEPKTGPTPTAEKKDYLETVKAMDKIRFEALRQKGLDAQRTALELFNKTGQKEQAIATLQQYIAYVESEQLDSDKTNMLKRPAESRIQQFKTQMAGDALNSAQKGPNKYLTHNERERNENIQKKQQEMLSLMKQGMELYKANKLKDAEAIAAKVLEIDPENVAARALKTQSQIKLKQQIYDKERHRDEEAHLALLGDGLGKIPSLDRGIEVDPTRPRRSPGSGEINFQLRNPKERAIESRLLQPISLHFKDVPLKQAIDTLKIESGVQIAPDYRALQQENISLEAPLTGSYEKISMKSALNLLLKPAGLTYTIQDEVLLITTERNRTTQIKRVTYPVGDLVNLPQSKPLPDVLNPSIMLERALTPVQVPYAGYGGYNNMPMVPQYSGGVPVSSSSTSQGLGSAFAGSQYGSDHHSPGHPMPRDRSPEAMAAMLKSLIMNVVAKNTWEDTGGHGQIQYFPMGMALVVNQVQEVQEEIMQLLASLRKLQDLQVSVELRAVLVSEMFFERIGLDFDMNIRTPTNRNEPALLSGNFVPAPFVNRNVDRLGGLISGLTPAGTLTPDLNIPIRNSTFNFTTPQFGGYQPEAGLSLGLAFLSDIQVFMFLEAVQGDRRAHIMQAPKLTVFNGETAFISGTVSRPQVTGMNPIATPSGQVIMVPTMSAIPSGLGMVVTPVVSPDRRFIRLNLTPQLSGGPLNDPAGAVVQAFPSGFTSGLPPVPLPNSPLQVTFTPSPVNLQIFNTTVNVPDGGTVLLGGFKMMQEERTEYGPPILSKIPYLSRLFRNVGWSRDGATLLYLVTARVIIVEEEENILLGTSPAIPR